LRQADEEVAASSFLTLEARVARALLQFTKYLGEPGAEDRVVIRDKIRQADLAALADVARENTSRIMSKWKKRRIIERRPNWVYVVHKNALEREVKTPSQASLSFVVHVWQKQCPRRRALHSRPSRRRQVFASGSSWLFLQ